MIYYSLPLWGGLFAFVFLGETMGTVHLISGALIIGGIVWASRTPKSVEKTETVLNEA